MEHSIGHKSQWNAYCQLIQELIAGTVRRNVFTAWEMRLLLDLQNARMRRSSRPEVLRRYLKQIEQQYASGAPEPVRFAQFFENDPRFRRTLQATAQRVSLPQAS